MPNVPDEDFSIIQTNFSNGISYSMADKDWLENSCRFSRNLAIFDNLNYITLNPKPIKDSGAVVTDLVKWMEATYPFETARYGYGDSGNIYRIASNIWSLDHTIASGTPVGNGLCQLGDGLFYATSTTIGRKFPLSSGSGTYNDDLFSDGVQNIDINFTASGQTYAIPTSITENQVNTLYFGSGGNGNTNLFAYDPIKAIQLYVTAKGTGDWTITLHDKQNTVLGSVTVVNGSLTNGQMNTFTFSTPVRIYIGATYHLHVTSTVNDGTLQTSSSNDLSTAQVKSQFGILISSTIHPMIQHANGVTAIFIVGNDHYLGTYDGITYNPNKITLEPGFVVRKITKINQNIVAYCTKGTDLTAYEEGRAYVWDGIQSYYTIGLPLTHGMPNTSVNFKNRLLGFFGLNGDFSLAPDETTPFRQIQQAPKLTKGYNVTIDPGAVSVWQKRALFGYSNTSDPNAGAYNDASAGSHVAGDTYTPPSGLEQGIYEFGNQSDRAITYTSVSTEVLNFAYQPSTAIVNPTNFEIGVVAAFGADIYFSYKDGSSYYVDRVNKLNNPVSTGSWESLINDVAIDKYGQLKALTQKKKLGVRVRVTFLALPAGATVTAKYRLDRTSAWTFGASSIAGSTSAVANIGGITGMRYKEIEYGFDITATTNYPYITSVGLFFKPLSDETISGFNL